MRTLIRLLIAIAAAGIGAVAGIFIAGAYVSATYTCSHQPGDPCDAGAMTAFGLMLILSPSLAVIFGGFGYWIWGRRRFAAKDSQRPLG